MKTDILPIATSALIGNIKPDYLPPGSYLAGGTACALWLGHRQSVDLDFFVPAHFEVNQWRQKWEETLKFTMLSQDWQTLQGSAGDVKLAIFYYKYPLIEPTQSLKEIQIASLEDIAAMKLEAVINRGTKRDFVDLYFLIRKFGLDGVFNYYDRKYGSGEERELLLRKALVYFEPAEDDEMPNMLISTKWDQVKKYLEKIVV